MKFKELPLEDRYDRLLDDLAFFVMLSYTHAKEQKTIKKFNDSYVDTMKKMLPGYLGVSIKLLKRIAPNKTFKKVFEKFVNTYLQAFHSLSDIEITWLSNQEANVHIKCEFIKKMEKMVKKTGLDIDSRIWCKSETFIYKELMKEFDLDVTLTPTTNGCQTNVKLKQK